MDNADLKRLAGWGVIALACYGSVEIVNALLHDPIGGYHRWIAMIGNGNYRTRGAWFFVLVGLWLYPGAPYLAARLLLRGRVAGSQAARYGAFALALLLLLVVLRLVTMGFASATIGIGN